MKEFYIAEKKMTCFKKNYLYNAEETVSFKPSETKFCKLTFNCVNPFFIVMNSVWTSCEKTYNDNIKVTRL